MSRRRSTPFAILGLLSLQPMSGYDLRKASEESVGHFWRESYGQIYPALRELTEAGLAHRRTERNAGRPDRHVYEITEKGRGTLRRWLVEPPRPTPVRSELLLKLFFGDAAIADTQSAWLEAMLAQSNTELETFRRMERQLRRERAGEPQLEHWLLTLRYGLYRAEANHRWAGQALAKLRGARGKAGAGRKAGARPPRRPARAT